MTAGTTCFLSYDGLTDPLGQSQILPYLEGLAQKGYRVHIISFEKAERFLQQRSVINEQCNRSGIQWHPLSYTAKPPVLSTLYDVWRLRQKAAVLHRRYSFQLIHCRSYITALVGEWMQAKYSIPFLFDMRGFWADERVDGHLWNQSNPIFKTVYRFFKRKELDFTRKADGIVSLTHTAKKEMQSWPHGRADIHECIYVIPCCVDMNLFDPAQVATITKADIRKRYKLPEKEPLLGYVGSIGTWYLFPEMLAAAKRWLLRQPNGRLLFLTPESPEMVISAAAKIGIPPSQLLVHSAPRKDMPALLACLQQAIFFIVPAYSKKASSPVKQGELMAMGIPVLCNSGIGDTDALIDQYQSGIRIDGFDDTTYDEGWRKMEETNWDPAAIRAGAAVYFSLTAGIDAYANVYEQLIHKKSR